jgi:cell wall-associated NlpC family hydrolase
MKKQIATQTQSWIGTKFLHQGRLKKTDSHDGGCDCIGLLIGVLKELKIKINFTDNKSYKRLVGDSILLDNLNKYLTEKDKSSLEAGDIVLFQFSPNLPPQHLGVINSNNGKLTLIHAYLKIGKVVEHLFDETWRSYLHSAFEITPENLTNE